jgi:uncharacterized repeat protein (TIGR03803 family)
LALAPNGNIYGISDVGATVNNLGTLFEITPNGGVTAAYTFCPHGGSGCIPTIAPESLVPAPNGDFYAAGKEGAKNYYCGSRDGCGTFFRIDSSGVKKTLHAFCYQQGRSDCPDGAFPFALFQGRNGDFYGLTSKGGANGIGTVFRITSHGDLSTLASLCTLGPCPLGLNGLMEAADGNLYGTSTSGGANSVGTIFKVAPDGTLSTFYNFCTQTNCADGADPFAVPIQGTDGSLYGTTYEGGAGSASGTVYRITPGGTLTTLFTFCLQGRSPSNCPDGDGPSAPLVQATDGNFYGTTALGGALSEDCVIGCGTIFRLSVGLPPFVKTLPDSGKTGDVISILGSNLTGASAVSFNGVPATFTIVSATQISTAVPAGATTGKIEVTTPTGKLLSGGPFIVRP